MAFTTLETRPGLRAEQRARLRMMSPGRIFAPAGYGAMLRRAGFVAVTERDITPAFSTTLAAWIAAYRRHRAGLVRVSGAAATAGGLRWYEDRLLAVQQRLIRRMLYVAER